MKHLKTFENYQLNEWISPKRQVDVEDMQNAIHRFKSAMPQVMDDISRLSMDNQRDFAHLYLWSLKPKISRMNASKSTHLGSIDKLEPVLKKYVDTDLHDEDLANAFISAIQTTKNMDQKIPVELAEVIDDVSMRMKN